MQNYFDIKGTELIPYKNSSIMNITKSLVLDINADDIKKSSSCSDLEATLKAEELRESMVEQGKDFTFETVLSTDRNLKLLKKAK